MLLLVVEPDLHQRRQLLQGRTVGLAQEPAHLPVHVGPEGVHLVDGGAADPAPPVPAVALAGLHVVGIEEVGVGLVRGLVAGEVGLQEEGLEEPAHVRQVPLGGADVLHRLDDVVLGGERLAELLRERPYRAVPVGQVLGRIGPAVGARGRGLGGLPPSARRGGRGSGRGVGRLGHDHAPPCRDGGPPAGGRMAGVRTARPSGNGANICARADRPTICPRGPARRRSPPERRRPSVRSHSAGEGGRHPGPRPPRRRSGPFRRDGLSPISVRTYCHTSRAGLAASLDTGRTGSEDTEA